jgi:ATP-dependent DNA helicase RecG
MTYFSSTFIRLNKFVITGDLMHDQESMSSTAFRRRYPAESQTVEFKQGVSETKIAEAVTAFSNTDGGVVLIGVAPTGDPRGTSVDGEALARLHRVVANVHRPGRYEIAALNITGVPLLALTVSRREGGYAQTTDGRVLVRRGAMNVALVGEQLDEFVTARALRRFETTAVELPDVAADADLLNELSQAYRWTGRPVERLIDYGFACAVGGRTCLTVAGALYLLPDPGSVLGKPYIEVFRYRDNDIEDKRYAVTGPLHHQVAEATARVLDEIGHDVVVLGVRRYELNRIPPEVLREAIANAVAHRVYEDNHRSVRIEIRSSRLTITSPGPLPEPVTVETMREQNAARNVRVIDALRRFRLAEDAGRGVDLIQDVMAEQLLDQPRFEADQRSVTVTLPLTSTVTASERAWVSEVETRGDLHPRDRILVVHAARGIALTNSYVRDLLGIDSTHARAALQRLRDAGLLRQTGHRAGARYLLGEDLHPPTGLRLTDRDLHRTILAMAAEQPITNQLVRERLALDRTEALRALKQLVADGRLVQAGQRRGTTYRVP